MWFPEVLRFVEFEDWELQSKTTKVIRRFKSKSQINPSNAETAFAQTQGCKDF